MEKLKADASDIIACTRRLKDLLNHSNMVEANLEKRSRELDLKEKELQNMSSDLDKSCRIFEAEKSNAADFKKAVEDCTQELRAKKNDLAVKLDSLTKVQGELVLKGKQLGQVKAQLRRCFNEAREVQERKKNVEDETARKTKDLGLVLVKIGESDKLLEKTSREVELKKKELHVLSLNLEKRGENFEADLKMNADGLRKEIEEKEKELDLIKSQVKSWERKLVQLRKLVDDHTTYQGDSSMNNQKEAELKKKQFGQAKTVLVKHNGVEEENLGLALPVKGGTSSEPEHRPVIFYTYQRRGN